MNRTLTETQYYLPGLPSGLKIALLSDLHGRDYHPVIESLKAHRPAIICITGDIIYGSYPVDDVSPLISQPNVLPFLNACNSIAPTFVSLGNHEQMLDNADMHIIGSTGVTVLDNRFVRVTVDGCDLVIGGLTSPYCLKYRKFREEYYRSSSTISADLTSVDTATAPLPRYPKKVLDEKDPRHDLKRRVLPDTSWLAHFASTSGYHILLSHHPEFVEQINASVVKCDASNAAPIDLVLSGHAHGGQWRVYHPVKKKWIGVFAPGQGLWPKLTEGIHEINKSTLVISRGLSNTAKIPRFFNKPEVVYISGSGNNP